jgi:hypothetical protein
MLKIITLSVLALSLAFAGEAETKLPASAQAVLDKAEAAVAANRAAYDKANVKPLAEAEKALRAEMEKFTKAGKLNEALAIQKALEGLRESVVASVDEKAKEKGDLLGEKQDPKMMLVGKWQMTITRVNGTTSVYPTEFFENGSVNDNRTATPIVGKWQISGNVLAITWTGGAVHSYQLPAMSGEDNGGAKLSLKKVK